MMTTNKPPTVSVLIPIYNVKKYLGECLESVLNQTFEDFEAICINDGSTDSSREIIQQYIELDPRFRVIDKPNSGYGASMNMGLDAARGKYIAILESDDRYAPEALERLYDAISKEPDIQVVKGDFNLFWSEPVERCEKFGINDGLKLNEPFSPRDDIRVFYKKPSIWSSLYSREFLNQNGIRFLETPGASYQDAGFSFKVWACASKIVLMDFVVLDYRQDNEQSSVNSPAKVFCVCDEYEEMQSWIEKDSKRLASLQGIVERMKYDSYLWNYDRLSPELQDGFLSVFSEEFRDDKAAGKIDFALFEPWAEADLHALIDSPELFKSCRLEYKAPGKMNTFKHYFKLGGFPLIFKVLAYKNKNGDR